MSSPKMSPRRTTTRRLDTPIIIIQIVYLQINAEGMSVTDRSPGYRRRAAARHSFNERPIHERPPRPPL